MLKKQLGCSFSFAYNFRNISNRYYARSRLYYPRNNRQLSSANTNGEKHIVNKLKQDFPNATLIKVEDISGGCGSMYEVTIESDDFKGKRLVSQHRMVNKSLSEEIKELHGIRINTLIPGEKPLKTS